MIIDSEISLPSNVPIQSHTFIFGINCFTTSKGTCIFGLPYADLVILGNACLKSFLIIHPNYITSSKSVSLYIE